MKTTEKSKALRVLSQFVAHRIDLNIEEIEDLIRIVEAEGDLHEDPIAYMMVQDAMDKAEGLNGKKGKIRSFNCRKFIKQNGIMAARFFSALNTSDGVQMREYIKANYPS